MKGKTRYTFYNDRMEFDGEIFPKLPGIRAPLNGKLQRVEYFDNDNNCVYQKTNDYNVTKTAEFLCIKAKYRFRAGEGECSVMESNGVYELTYYPFESYSCQLAQVSEKNNEPNMSPIVKHHSYEYWSDFSSLPKLNAKGNSRNSNSSSFYKYSGNFSKGIYEQMKTSKHILNIPIEEIERDNGGIIGGRLSTYKLHGSRYVPDKVYRLETAIPLSTYNEFDGETMDAHYSPVPEIEFVDYDSYGNVKETKDKAGIYSSYIWGYNGQYPIARIYNISSADLAFSDFESEGQGGWQWSGAYRSGTSFEGSFGLVFTPVNNGIISRTGLDPSKSYRIRFWFLNEDWAEPVGEGFRALASKDDWVLYEKIVSGVSTYSFSSTRCIIDNILILPMDSEVTMYTYDPLVGMTSKTDNRGVTEYYEYDNFNRLSAIRDHDGHLLESYCYNYAGQQVVCGPIFYSHAQSRTLLRNDCGPGYHGSEVTYTVPAGTYSAATQAEADGLALADLNASAQDYANIHGQCIPDGVYVWTCTSNWATSMNGDYEEAYADVYIMVSRDAEGKLGIGGSRTISYSNGQGIQSQVTVTGNAHHLGMRLQRREYKGYIPPGMDGEVIEYEYEALPSPYYTILTEGGTPCGEAVESDPEVSQVFYLYSPVHEGLCDDPESDTFYRVADNGQVRLYTDAQLVHTASVGYYRSMGQDYYLGTNGVLEETENVDCEDEEEPGAGTGYLYALNQAALCNETEYMEVHEKEVGGTMYLYDSETLSVFVPQGYYRSMSGLDYQVGNDGIRVKITDAACEEQVGMLWSATQAGLCALASAEEFEEMLLIRVGGQRYLYADEIGQQKAPVGYYRGMDGHNYHVDATGLLTEVTALACGGWAWMYRASVRANLCNQDPEEDPEQWYRLETGGQYYLYFDDTLTTPAPVGYYRDPEEDRDYQVGSGGLLTELTFMNCN